MAGFVSTMILLGIAIGISVSSNALIYLIYIFAAIVAVTLACLLIFGKPVYSLLIFIVLMPFHPLIISLLLTYTSLPVSAIRAFAAWKEALIIIQIIRVILFERKKIILVDVLAMLFLMFVCLTIFLPSSIYPSAPELLKKLYAARDASFYIGVFFVGRYARISNRDLGRILKTLFIVGVLASLAGFIEYFFLPIESFVTIGYVNYSHFLGFSWNGIYGLPENLFTVIGGALVRRMASFFLMSNIFGQALIIFVPVIVYYRSIVRPSKRWMVNLALVTALLALFMTITRMSIVACIIGFFLGGYLLRDKFVSQIAGLLLFGIMLVGVFIIIYFPETGLFTTQDTSISTHFMLWEEASVAILNTPFLGYGPGTGGTTSVKNLGTGLESITFGTESQYLSTAVQFGIPALFLNLWFVLLTLWLVYRVFKVETDWRVRGVCLVTFVSGIGLSLNAVSTSIYSVTFTTYIFWWLAGLSIQKGIVNDVNPVTLFKKKKKKVPKEGD